MGAKIKAPKGYRLLKKGETIPTDYMWWDRHAKSWARGFSLDTGRKEGFAWAGGRPYPHAVHIVPKVPKPKAPKLHTWEPRTLEIGPKVTKEGIRIQAEVLLDLCNNLGAENAKLKNQNAALRRKAKEAK